MKEDRFSIKQFNQQFPDDDACLEYIFGQRFPNGAACPKCHKTGRYHRVSTRKCYSCECGHQVSPTEGTIFHKSSTKLKTWFLAMFYMTASKNGVSAKELERMTGVTYKTAWRMAHQIRKLMTQGEGLLSGVVEADETYYGGKRTLATAHSNYNKTPIIGALKRKGEVRAKVVSHVNAWQLKQVLNETVSKHTHLITDEHVGYGPHFKAGNVAAHSTVKHSEKEYVRAEIHTNSIEGFWSQLKRSIHGTFHQVGR